MGRRGEGTPTSVTTSELRRLESLKKRTGRAQGLLNLAFLDLWRAHRGFGGRGSEEFKREVAVVQLKKNQAGTIEVDQIMMKTRGDRKELRDFSSDSISRHNFKGKW
ncbi:hypothetical protein QJS10_CPB11g00661 [Acorus calamus]|uniref:Uncharacterized protein n=1 Tax=Acorus calamus TaxID=4465 RepID=A0AAV9DRA1_ACOCL|nr:hypothetical protein QJS10_CPB11g00661 [Acorus calamus]